MAGEELPDSPSSIMLEQAEKKEDVEELERRVRLFKRLAIVLGVIILLLGAIVIKLFVSDIIADKICESPSRDCGTRPEGFQGQPDLLDEPDNPVTESEILRIREFLAAEIELPSPSKYDSLYVPRIYTIDLELPPKAEVKKHLDEGAEQPDRIARVMVLRGDLDPPVTQEYLCGPLKEISACTLDKTVSFSLRPTEKREFEVIDVYLIPEIQHRFGDILRESFNGSYDYEECEDDCLNYWTVPIANGIPYKDAEYTRRWWLWTRYDIPYYNMFPLDMGFLLVLDGADGTNFYIEKVWYADVLYDNLDDFVTGYRNNTVPKSKRDRPTGINAEFTTLASRMTREEKHQNHQRPPQLVEPDGKRYSIRHGRIEYMNGLWSFHYRMSPLYGPAIYDVRFKGERIAYEISLMELAVQYYGFNPMERYCQWIDSAFGMGTGSKAVFLGADCPSTATLLPAVFTSQVYDEPGVFPHASCVFEQNSGRPLRRHHSYSVEDGSFFGGMLDSALTLRSIHVVENYDYLVDFTFHQNGAIGFHVLNTGYVMTSFYNQNSAPYGFEFSSGIYGPLHTHFVHVKVDLDINGVSNRYETLKVKEELQDLRQFKGEQISMGKIERSVRQSEIDANYRYDFNTPTYNVFYNDKTEDDFGNKRSYQLHTSGIAPQITQQENTNEPGLSWARYQISVTKQKDNEKHSSSPFNQWESNPAHLDFSTFYKDDENIVDEDLVAWVTLASAHIVHTEDVPVTSSIESLSFHLIPFNYFSACPSSSSPDVTYMAFDQPETPVFEIPGNRESDDTGCHLTMYNISATYDDGHSFDFEVHKKRGVY